MTCILLKQARVLLASPRDRAIAVLLPLGVAKNMHTPRKQSELPLAPSPAPRLHVPTQPPVTDPLAEPAVSIPLLSAMAMDVLLAEWPLMLIHSVHPRLVPRLARCREILIPLARCSTVPPLFLILVPLALVMA